MVAVKSDLVDESSSVLVGNDSSFGSFGFSSTNESCIHQSTYHPTHNEAHSGHNMLRVTHSFWMVEGVWWVEDCQATWTDFLRDCADEVGVGIIWSGRVCVIWAAGTLEGYSGSGICSLESLLVELGDVDSFLANPVDIQRVILQYKFGEAASGLVEAILTAVSKVCVYLCTGSLSMLF